MKVLCGDIGGTKTRLGIFDTDKFNNAVSEKSYASSEYSSLSEISLDFLSDKNIKITHAAFGIAGPIFGRKCRATNLPWEIDAGELEQELGISTVHLINDLEATAYGITALGQDDLHTLQEGVKNASGNRAVIAAGTGLGQAGMFWDGNKHTPFATEGGHCDFAPSSEMEYELNSSLKRHERNVCWEEILSGPGLVSIYSFLLDRHHQQRPNWLDHKRANGDPAEEITQGANDNDPICVETLKIFSRLYGAETGNLALKMMATGGIYIGGGIAPKILNWLQQPLFLEAFLNKGKMKGLMESIPVHVVLNDRAALFGPAIYLRENLTSCR